MISNGMHCTTTKSVRLNGDGRFYWFLHQDTGHILEISEPFSTMTACLDDMASIGNVLYDQWKSRGLK